MQALTEADSCKAQELQHGKALIGLTQAAMTQHGPLDLPSAKPLPLLTIDTRTHLLVSLHYAYCIVKTTAGRVCCNAPYVVRLQVSCRH